MNKIDWTKAWSGKYPILAKYKEEVDVKKYSDEINRLFNEIEEKYGYSKEDAMLVLKDILYHTYKEK